MIKRHVYPEKHAKKIGKFYLHVTGHSVKKIKNHTGAIKNKIYFKVKISFKFKDELIRGKF